MPTKVMTIVGTRPEVIKLSRVIHELDATLRQVLVHTGQNYDYELNQVFFDQLGIRKPDHFLGVADASLGEVLGNVLARSYEILQRERPDALLLLGDTNSCLAAICAKRLKIPVFHMEAGNRCFDERVPEEINRRLVDHVSDVNLVYTEHARRYLLAEGLRPELVIKTGSPMREVLEHYREPIEASTVLADLELSQGAYFLVSAHREENVDDETRLATLLDTLRTLQARWGHPMVFSTHPRTRKRLAQLGVQDEGPDLRFLPAMGFFEYAKLEMNAFCVLSDSGTITEESSILDFPAVTIREAHERPEGMDEGTLVMCGVGRERVLEAVETVTQQQRSKGRSFRMVGDYAPTDVARKVVRIILSYVDYVNRVIWRSSG
jgi:UDP-N-acetylglucosamine 2-epimerase (non-hydrolysing)